MVGAGSPRFLFQNTCAVVLLAHLPACMAQYKPPTSAEPHAILKIRRHYAAPVGVRLSESIVLDGTRVLSASKAATVASAPQTDAVLVRPKESNLEVGFSFTHQESRMVYQSYSCGTYQVPRSCSRMVNQPVTVVDSRCEREIGVNFEAGKTYLVELDSLDRGECSMRCFEQASAGQGRFTNKACMLLPMDGKSKRARE
jgi:hypothetical protein